MNKGWFEPCKAIPEHGAFLWGVESWIGIFQVKGERWWLLHDPEMEERITLKRDSERRQR